MDEDFSFREWTKDQIRKQFVDMTAKSFKERHIIGIGEIGEFHEDARFEVSKIRGDSWFFTNDNPLVTDDMVTKNEHPFLKSKNFSLPLNPKYQLKIFHDKTIPRNIIGGCTMVSADVAVANGTIVGQSLRFIIGTNESFDHYFAMVKAMNESPSKLIVNVMRQTVDTIKPSKDNIDLHELFLEYLKIHDSKDYLTEKNSTNFTNEWATKPVIGKKIEFSD